MSTEIDVLIIGAGPAGCSTALHLARINPALARRTVLLDRTEHPRDKLCGGGLVPDVDAILERLGLDMSAVPQVNAKRARLHFHSRGIPIQLSDIAFHVVRRRDFDAWLAANAQDCGVVLRPRTRVLNLEADNDGVTVETDRGRLRARVVIGADGSKGLTRRLVAGDAGSLARLIEIRIPSPTGPSPEPRTPVDEAHFEFRHVPAGVQGYYWNFPMPSDLGTKRNIGIYDSRVHDDSPLAGSLKHFLESELQRIGVRLEDCKLEGHPLHLFAPTSRLSTANILLAGDAAGADPLLGEGISLALGYGQLAASAVHDSFARSDFSFTNYTQQVLASPMGTALRQRYRTARLVYKLRHPAWQKLMWWYLQPAVRYLIRNHFFGWAVRASSGPGLTAAMQH